MFLGKISLKQFLKNGLNQLEAFCSKRISDTRHTFFVDTMCLINAVVLLMQLPLSLIFIITIVYGYY